MIYLGPRTLFLSYWYLQIPFALHWRNLKTLSFIFGILSMQSYMASMACISLVVDTHMGRYINIYMYKYKTLCLVIRSFANKHRWDQSISLCSPSGIFLLIFIMLESLVGYTILPTTKIHSRCFQACFQEIFGFQFHT